MSPGETVRAELTWTGAGFEPGIELELSADGRLARVGPIADTAVPAAPGGRELRGRALLPGFVNAHSHAFQRGLRGQGERFPGEAGSFWSWREAMYGLVAGLDADRFFELSLLAFREMLAAGITTSGEFHYLHHARPDGGDYELDRALAAAAREAGIRLVLLNAYYSRGGPGRALEGAQARFRTGSPAEYWERMDALAAELDPRGQSLGAVVHSVRAATIGEIEAVHAGARERGLVLHMHVEEQRREIEECVEEHGKPPLPLLLERLAINEGFTAVHGTCSRPADLAALFEAGATLCVCPTTEANLGDGIPDLAAAPAAPAERGLALGTDSNARISMLEEMRWLEYGQRLARERRGVLRGGNGAVAPALLRAATRGGARSLGIEAGEIRAGALADLVAVDLSHPDLAGWERETLLESLVFGAGSAAIAEVCVGGRWVRAGA